jgi:hypothetical protein
MTWDNFCGDLGIFRERVAQLGNQAPKRRMERLALIQRTESFRASGMDGFSATGYVYLNRHLYTL